MPFSSSPEDSCDDFQLRYRRIKRDTHSLVFFRLLDPRQFVLEPPSSRLISALRRAFPLSPSLSKVALITTGAEKRNGHCVLRLVRRIAMEDLVASSD